jgi:hypothetical protein
VVMVLSIINYESDLAKFLFSGYSSTYDVVMIRHSPYLVISLAVVIIFLSIVEKIKKILRLKYAIPFLVVFWILSMRSSAYVYSDDTLVSGWSFIRIRSYKCQNEKETPGKSEIGSCNIDLDPFLDRKLKEKLKLH